MILLYPKGSENNDLQSNFFFFLKGMICNELEMLKDMIDSTLSKRF